ncbi:MAG: hypothetical protein P8P99_03610 [Maricaulis sp.]|nr:hypothetical protein [Maricaulis sp.]
MTFFDIRNSFSTRRYILPQMSHDKQTEGNSAFWTMLGQCEYKCRIDKKNMNRLCAIKAAVRNCVVEMLFALSEPEALHECLNPNLPDTAPRHVQRRRGQIHMRIAHNV